MPFPRSAPSVAPSPTGTRRSSTTIEPAASNGPTEGMNFCAKQVNGTGRGFTNFKHYRLRVLLYAGGVHWPTTIRPPRITFSPSPLIPEEPD